MYKIFLPAFIFIFAYTQNACAQSVFYSQKSGLWNDAAMWNSATDGSGITLLDPNNASFSLVIQAGHQLVLNKSRLVRNLTIAQNAKLSNGITLKRRLILHGNLVCNGTMGNGNTPDSISIEVEGANCSIGGAGVIDALSIKKQDAVNATTNLVIDANVTLHDVGGVLSNSKKNTIFNVILNQGKTLTALGSPTVGADVCIDGSDGTNGDERGGNFTIDGSLIVFGKLYLTTDNALPAFACTFKIGTTGSIEVKNELRCDSSKTALHNFIMLPNAQLILSGTGNVVDNFSKFNNSYSIDAAATIEFRGGVSQRIENDINYPKLLLSGAGSTKTMKGDINHRGVLEIKPLVTLLSPTEKADIKMQANIINNGTIGNSLDSISIDAACATCTFSGNGTTMLRKIVKKGDINPTTNLILDANITLKATNGVLYTDKNLTIFNLTINQGKTLLLTQGNAGIDIAEPSGLGYTPKEQGGNWLVYGTLNVGGTLYLTTDNALTNYPCTIQIANGGLLQTNHITTANSAAAGHNFVVKMGAKLGISGNFPPAATQNNQYALEPNSLTEYNGSAAQTLNPTLVYANLNLKNGAKLLSNSINISQNMSIENAASLNLAAQTLSLQGNFMDNNIAASGLVPQMGKIVFSGINTQNVSAMSNSLSLYNVEINNASNIYLTTNADIQNQLKFVAGKLTHSASTAPTLKIGSSLLNDNAARCIKGAMLIETNSQNAYRTSAWSASGNNISIVPLGSTPSKYKVEMIDAAAPTAGFAGVIKRVSDLEYMDISRVSGNEDVHLKVNWSANFLALNNIADITKLELAHLQNGAWQVAGVATLRSGSLAAGALESGSISSFSPFALGANVGILPVSWLGFSGKQQNENVFLQWQTATETNNDYFEVQRKLDTEAYKPLAQIKGNGTTTQIQNYVFTDFEPLNAATTTTINKILYRLAQIDFDGKINYSPEMSINFVQKSINDLQLVQTEKNIRIATKQTDHILSYQLIDMQGRAILANAFLGSTDIATSELSQGIYLLKVSSDLEQVFMQKIWVKN